MSDQDTVSVDTLKLNVMFVGNMVSQANWQTGLINNAFASSGCDPPPPLGFHTEVKSIKLMSDEQFKGLPVGSTLNDYASFLYGWENEKLPLSVAADSLNNNDYLFYGMDIFIHEKPANSLPQTFTIEFEMVDGRKFQGHTVKFTWL